jgi:hypothetical protein
MSLTVIANSRFNVPKNFSFVTQMALCYPLIDVNIIIQGYSDIPEYPVATAAAIGKVYFKY